MKTEDIIRFEVEWKAMRSALGTHLLVIEFASVILAAEARLGNQSSSSPPPASLHAEEQPERPSLNVPLGT